MTSAELTPPQIVALSRELDDVVTLFRHGRATLQGLNFVTLDSSVVFACLSGGVEKVLKLSLGLLSMEEDGRWPSRTRMKEWGHDIPSMDTMARSKMAERVHLSAAQPYVTGLLDAVASDEQLARLLEIMGRHAMAGRFHNLDTLAAEQTRPAPQQLWEEMEMSLLQADEELLAAIVFAGPAGQAARLSLNRRIDSSLASWQLLYFRAWQHGLLGERARQWSGQLLGWSG
jgi:hypothetical protein